MLTLLPLLFSAPASGQDVPLGHVRAWTESVRELYVPDDAPIWLDGGLELTDGLVTIQLDDGYVVPIRSGRTDVEWRALEGTDEWIAPQHRGPRDVVGFVWVAGTGTMSVGFPDPGDASWFANRMERHGGLSVSELAPLARDGEPFTTGIERGLVLGGTADIVGLIGEQLAIQDDPYYDATITVVGERRPSSEALREAKTVFAERTRLYDDAHLYISDHLALDRLRHEVYGSPARGARLVADFQTSLALPLVVQDHLDPNDEDWEKLLKSPRRLNTSWLTVLRDDTGVFDVRRRTTVVSMHRDLVGDVRSVRIAGEPFSPMDPSDPLSAPAPPARIEPDFARTTVVVLPAKNDAQLLRIQVDNELTATVRGEGTVVGLRVPRGVHRKGLPIEVDVRLADGTSVLWELPEWDEDLVWLALPRRYADGEVLELRVRYVAFWPYGNWDHGQEQHLGVTSGLQSVIPAFAPGLAGNAWRFETTVGVPARSPLRPAVAGDTVKEWEDEHGRYVTAAQTAGTAMWPQVAVGAWNTRFDLPFQDLPGVRVLLLGSERGVIETFAPEVRRIVVFLHGFLPAFPWTEVDVIEDARQPGAFRWVAPHGMVQVEKALVINGHGGMRNKRPHLENGILAHEIAHQYWGHVARPANTRDFWIAETFAELYACAYLAAAFERRDCDVRMDDHRKTWEKELAAYRVDASLTRAYESSFQGEVVYAFGPYVFLEMLQPRIGPQAFWSALDLLLQDHAFERITTERLQRYFEVASGQDLGDFFDFWVYGGHVPKVGLTWRELPDGRVGGTISSDVPFGTFDVPVWVRDGAGTSQTVSVVVTDGEGRFETSQAFEGRPKVVLDPNGRIMARGRVVRRER